MILGTPKKMVEEVQQTLTNWTGKGMVATRELRSFLGKLAWIAGIVPRLRWMTSLDAVLGKVLQEEDKEDERSQKRLKDQRPKHGLVAVKRFGTALPWLQAAFETPDHMLVRYEPLDEKGWGRLIHRVGPTWHMVEAFGAHAGLRSSSLGRTGRAQSTSILGNEVARWASRGEVRQFCRTCHGEEVGVTHKDAELHSLPDSAAPGESERDKVDPAARAGKAQPGSGLAIQERRSWCNASFTDGCQTPQDISPL